MIFIRFPLELWRISWTSPIFFRRDLRTIAAVLYSSQFNDDGTRGVSNTSLTKCTKMKYSSLTDLSSSSLRPRSRQSVVNDVIARSGNLHRPSMTDPDPPCTTTVLSTHNAEPVLAVSPSFPFLIGEYGRMFDIQMLINMQFISRTHVLKPQGASSELKASRECRVCIHPRLLGFCGHRD